ncbi:MAG: c-type cytochrome, partial [Verrucomicrobiota bacterium]|nr:c-type cytochrome [Verrucomicrobiota bacterium]
RPAWARRLLNAVDTGTLDRNTIGRDSVLLMATYGDEHLQRLLTKHFGTIRLPGKEKAQRIRGIKDLLASGKIRGNKTSGRHLFGKHCAQCHKFGDQGRDIGPDLTGYEMKNLDYLIPAIVDPNLGIRDGFELATLTLQPVGEAPPAILTGFLQEENERTIAIKDLTGIRTVVARKDVASLNQTPVSVMPEGLLDPMTPQQIHDLVAYLQSGN